MMLKATTTGKQPITGTGFILLIVCASIGALLGIQLPAAHGDGFTDLTVITDERGQGAFNWLLFSVFAAAGLLAFAVCLAAAAVCTTAHNLAVVAAAGDE